MRAAGPRLRGPQQRFPARPAHTPHAAHCTHHNLVDASVVDRAREVPARGVRRRAPPRGQQRGAQRDRHATRLQAARRSAQRESRQPLQPPLPPCPTSSAVPRRVCVRLASTERATARVMQEGSALRRVPGALWRPSPVVVVVVQVVAVRVGADVVQRGQHRHVAEGVGHKLQTRGGQGRGCVAEARRVAPCPAQFILVPLTLAPKPGRRLGAR